MALHRTIVVVEVAGFGSPRRPVREQLLVHEALYDLLNTAFAESGIDLERATVEDRGDGAMVLLPPEVPKSRLVDGLPDRLVAGLRRYNALRHEEAAIRLRVGLHTGEVRQDPHGVVGPAINFAFRIIDTAEAKSALRMSDSVLALIASESFYHDVVMNDPAANPESYRRISVRVKETHAEAWLSLPGKLLPSPAQGAVAEGLKERTTAPALLLLGPAADELNWAQYELAEVAQEWGLADPDVALAFQDVTAAYLDVLHELDEIMTLRAEAEGNPGGAR